MSYPMTWRLAAALALLAFAARPLPAQAYSSGSNGTDGALTFPPNAGQVVFNPSVLGIDPDKDNVFHFTTITIPVGTTVRLGADVLGEGRPVAWLATAGVAIHGTINLNGGIGHLAAELSKPSVPGAGGYAGGAGGKFSSPSKIGSGPGGGRLGSLHGGPAGHVDVGVQIGGIGMGQSGPAYGTALLLPIVGGSGGAGGVFHPQTAADASGGGAGGGALVIASSDSITLNGSIIARGGDGGTGPRGLGGGGSGGAVRLVAPIVAGTGAIEVRGGRSPAPLEGLGAAGRVRLEASDLSFNGTVVPLASSSLGSPAPALLPPTAPRVRVTKVAGVAVPPDPTGSFVLPDVTIDASTPVTLDIEAANIPVGTRVSLAIVTEPGGTQTYVSTALAGTRQQSTAAITGVTLPHGVTRCFVTATWTP